eukprot:6182788-Pleurochrysis_carterae.AAC.1
MDDHANFVLAYMAQNADEGIEYKAQGGGGSLLPTLTAIGPLHPPPTTGLCIMYDGVAVSYGSKRQHCNSLSSTEAEIVAASH